MNPEITLFGEPASALDLEMVKEALDTMAEPVRGRTMICMTLEMGFARQLADGVIFMDAGAIIETDYPGAFLTSAKDPRTKLFLGQIL